MGHAQDDAGQYSFGYNDGSSVKQEIKTADGVIRGAYSYVDSDGIVQNVNYIADALGFRVGATNLPVHHVDAPVEAATPVQAVAAAAPCAVLFDENCCKASKDHLVVKKGEQGKLCGTASGFNPLSSCKGSGLKDDIEALFVMPGCKLEVWDHGSGLEDALDEERKGFNQG